MPEVPYSVRGNVDLPGVEEMKYQLRMIVEVDETKKDGFFTLEDWMTSLPVDKGDLVDFGMAETERELLEKNGDWEDRNSHLPSNPYCQRCFGK